MAASMFDSHAPACAPLSMVDSGDTLGEPGDLMSTASSSSSDSGRGERLHLAASPLPSGAYPPAAQAAVSSLARQAQQAHLLPQSARDRNDHELEPNLQKQRLTELVCKAHRKE